MIPLIDLKAQYAGIKSEINNRINRVLEHGHFIMGPEVRELEERLERYTSAKHCITVASGTEALLISLMALGVKPGDEVITTPFTFAATAEVIVLLGAKPVFVDVEMDTCNINASLIEAKITDKTKAIMPVSLYGQPCNMDEINHIASQYKNIPVIEDGAQSFGSVYKGRKSGNLSMIGCTSFFPSKPLGCYGDGGAIFTSDDEIAKVCREIRVHGQSSRYVHSRIGVGGRMDTIQCAILLAKLEIFDWEIERRIEIGAKYNALADLAKISRVYQRSDRTSVFSQYTLFTDSRVYVQEKLINENIYTTVHYPIPINKQDAYKRLCSSEEFPISNMLSERVLSLPMHPYMCANDQEKIIALIQQ